VITTCSPGASCTSTGCSRRALRAPCPAGRALRHQGEEQAEDRRGRCRR
jgi:hypothetical protein